ncbi:MAG: hypothetical protein ACOYB7_02975 [Mycobacterium sp.]
MKPQLSAAVLAIGGIMTIGMGTAAADVIQVEGSYSTPEACRADGPYVQITENDGAYSQWQCHEGDDGLWYLFLGG